MIYSDTLTNCAREGNQSTSLTVLPPHCHTQEKAPIHSQQRFLWGELLHAEVANRAEGRMRTG